MTTETIDLERALPISEAARRYGCSTTWTRQQAEAGHVHAVKTPLGWLFDPDDVDRVIADREKERATR